MAPQHVRIRLLGGFDVQVDGATVPAGVWRLNKARSLLKLLALAEGNRLPAMPLSRHSGHSSELWQAPTICIRRCTRHAVRS
jgi:hypothetical protein